MSAAATDTSCLGDTSMNSMRSGGSSTKSPPLRHEMISSVKRPRASSGTFACAIAYFDFFHRREIDDLARHLAVLDAAIRAFDEAVFVHARIGRERVDQADVRAFRRFDRADAAVVRRMHVAHFEARALARQAARPKRREAALVRDFRERVRLVHELRELRGAEELAHRGRRRLRVDQIVRHDGVDLDRRHALLDRALHAQEADAVLVLHQLADRAHAAVGEVVDVVDLALAVAQIVQNA